MKYKVGDKVRVKSLEWYKENLSNPDVVDFVFEMSKYCGLIGVITGVSLESNTYKIYINDDDTAWYWCDTMLEDLIDEPCEYCENYYYYLEDGYYYPLENQKYCAVCGRKLNKRL